MLNLNSLAADAMVTPAQLSIQTLRLQAASLLLYQAIWQTEIGQAFLRLLELLQERESNRIHGLQAYGQWFHTLAHAGLSWQDYLLVQLLRADNPFSRQAQITDLADLPPALVQAAQQDLRSLQILHTCTGEQISQWVETFVSSSVPAIAWDLPSKQSCHPEVIALRQTALWRRLQMAAEMAEGDRLGEGARERQSGTECQSTRAAERGSSGSGRGDWAELLPELAAHYRRSGCGIFAQYPVFRWRSQQLQGIPSPDPIQLDELVGYESQKATLIKNTVALLAGYPALHVLLYGSRGSGKSSLVKALLPAYASKGLRLIEVAKADLPDLPAIVDRLRPVPQKFIIFVDDLSFEADDDAYKALKVVLEGNVTARPPNVVIYATSNRRHLIREFFADRPRPQDADEVHAWDTMQEKLSFSDRFGLTLTFEPANQDTYLTIVYHLAHRANLTFSPEELQFRALQWATRQNGRSGRSARQFVDFLQAETSPLEKHYM